MDHMVLYSEGTDNKLDVKCNGLLAKIPAPLYLYKYLSSLQFGIAATFLKRWCLFFQTNSGISHMTFFAHCDSSKLATSADLRNAFSLPLSFLEQSYHHGNRPELPYWKIRNIQSRVEQLQLRPPYIASSQQNCHLLVVTCVSLQKINYPEKQNLSDHPLASEEKMNRHCLLLRFYAFLFTSIILKIDS